MEVIAFVAGLASTNSRTVTVAVVQTVLTLGPAVASRAIVFLVPLVATTNVGADAGRVLATFLFACRLTIIAIQRIAFVTIQTFTFSRLPAMCIYATTRADRFTSIPMNLVALVALTNIDLGAETIRRTAFRALWRAEACLSAVYISCLTTAYARHDTIFVGTFASVLTLWFAGTTAILLVALVAFAFIISDTHHVGRAARRTMWLAAICHSVVCISRLASACLWTYALLVRTFATVLTVWFAGTTVILLVAFVTSAFIISNAHHIGRAARRTVWLTELCFSVVFISRLTTTDARHDALLM